MLNDVYYLCIIYFEWCVYMCVYVCVCTCVYVGVCVCMCMCVYICVCMQYVSQKVMLLLKKVSLKLSNDNGRWVSLHRYFIVKLASSFSRH